MSLQAMLDDIRAEMIYVSDALGKTQFDERVMTAMRNVPRDQFVPDSMRRFAFIDGPVSIGHGQTISQPFIVALMTELLETKEGDVILEIGTGSGYQSAVLATLVKHVYTIEIIDELAQSAQTRLKELGYLNITGKSDNGYYGWKEHAPYDGIIVTAAAPYIPPALIEQLRVGGKMVIPVGAPYDYQELILLEKKTIDDFSTRRILGVAFVPLTGIFPKEEADIP